MTSEFYTVALDQIRYALVWEDSRTLHEALAIGPADHVLVVTSAGCNVLNALLRNPRAVTAIDLNPAQNNLLQLKCHLIRHHEPAVLRALMGFDGPAAVARAWQAVAPTLPPELRRYWQPFFAGHPAGILTAGRLERYLTAFLPTLAPAMQAKVRQLLQFDSVAEQYAFFRTELDGTAFQAQFVTYFDEANLSKGRDPALFRYATESGGAAFYARLREMLRTKLARNNFFFRFFFFGPEHLPEALLPPCYQRQHHAPLRQQLDKLTIVTGEATQYLHTPAGRTITKASLSNIFEYTSPAEFRQVMHGLLTERECPLRLVYWNLLQDQGMPATDEQPQAEAVSERLSREDGCFYFRNVRVLTAACQVAVAAPACATCS